MVVNWAASALLTIWPRVHEHKTANVAGFISCLSWLTQSILPVFPDLVLVLLCYLFLADTSMIHTLIWIIHSRITVQSHTDQGQLYAQTLMNQASKTSFVFRSINADYLISKATRNRIQGNKKTLPDH